VPLDQSRYLALGEIVGIHGIKGRLKVLSYAESVEPFAPGKKLILSRKGTPVGTFAVASCRPHKGIILIELDGIQSIEAAEVFVGCELLVDKKSLPRLEKVHYYWFEIIGLEVYTLDNRALGRVRAVFPTGSNDVYVVRDAEKEVLIPALDSVVVDIDLKKRIMKVDLPEGLED
jgi:16S rRNA processing protein RimM